MSLIYNEQTKLAANNLDRLSTALVVVGVLGKTFDFTPGTGLFVPMLSVAGWIVSAGVLHFIARSILGRLKP